MYIYIICAVFRLKLHSSTSTSRLRYTVNRHKENKSNFNYSIRFEVILQPLQFSLPCCTLQIVQIFQGSSRDSFTDFQSDSIAVSKKSYLCGMRLYFHRQDPWISGCSFQIIQVFLRKQQRQFYSFLVRFNGQIQESY